MKPIENRENISFEPNQRACATSYAIQIAYRIFQRIPNASKRELLNVALFSLPFELHFELSKRILDEVKRSATDEELNLMKEKFGRKSNELEDWSDYISFIAKEFLTQLPKLSKKIVSTCFDFSESHLPKNLHENYLSEKLAELEEHFSLSNLDKEIIKILFTREILNEFSELLSDRTICMESLVRNTDRFALILGVSRFQVISAVNSSAKLTRSGLIAYERNLNVQISNLLVEFLNDSLKGTLAEEFFEKITVAPNIKSSQSTVTKDCLSTIRHLLKSNEPQNILFFGEPGGGKTILAKALGAELGFEVFAIKQTTTDGEESLKSRKTSLISAQKMLPQKALLIVDECDPIINTDNLYLSFVKDGTDGKSWINHYLENSRLKIIWITNHTHRIDDSTKRRFSIAVEFGKLGSKQRETAFQNQKKATYSNFLTDSNLKRLSSRYRVSPGIIAQALKNVTAINGKLNRQERTQVLEEILKRQENFIEEKAPTLNPLSSIYDPVSLNTSIPLEKILKGAKTFLTKGNSLEVYNFNLLLAGPPGTGKTEYAKYLADSLHKELLVKRSSDLISMWVGQTEKNIKKAFQEAQDTNAILFLDEADSFFIDRSRSEKSWEVTQTNELLCQMENFRGISIYATNFVNNLDPAIVRRLIYKVEFKYLSPEGVIRQFEKHFAKYFRHSLTGFERGELSRLKNLTPGDFKVARQHFLLGEEFSFSKALEALTSESRAKLDGSGKPKLGLHTDLTYLN